MASEIKAVSLPCLKCGEGMFLETYRSPFGNEYVMLCTHCSSSQFEFVKESDGDAEGYVVKKTLS